jgi:hypothetical protein
VDVPVSNSLARPHPGLLRTASQPEVRTTGLPQIMAVGTAVPDTAYAQRDLVDVLGIADPKIRSIYLNSAIDRRFLTLPEVGPDGARVLETTGQLLAKHKAQGLAMGSRAVQTSATCAASPRPGSSPPASARC